MKTNGSGKAIRRTWGSLSPVTRIHGEGKKAKGFNRAKAKREWKTGASEKPA